MTNRYHPKFLQAAAELQRLNANPVEDEFHHLWHLQILEDLYRYAPEEAKALCEGWLRQAKWRRACIETERLEEREGPEALLKKEHEDLFTELLMNAPPDVIPTLIATSKELGLWPDAAHVDSQGVPIYDPVPLAESFGVSVLEICGFIRAAGFAVGGEDAEDVNRIQ